MDLPSLGEQRRIAEILSTWDRAIETSDQLIANSLEQKKAIAQQLLTGKRRLHGFKKEWEFTKLGNLCTVRRGASPRPISDKKWFSDTGRGWVRISDVTRSNTERLENTDQYLSLEGSENSVAVDPGELIMSICATIGVPKFVGVPVCIHDGFVVFREVSEELHLPFLFYVLEHATERLALGGQPGTQRNINTGIVANILVPKIALKEQQAIAEILRCADQSLRNAKDQHRALREERAALIQQLLSGTRRIPIDKDIAA